MAETKERREHSRLNAYHLVKYRLASELQAEPVLASVKDISGGGVCLRTKEKLPLSGVIQLYINFPRFPEPIPCLAKIVWIRRIGKFHKYDIGIKFLDIEEALRSEIGRRIDSVYEKTEKQARDYKRGAGSIVFFILLLTFFFMKDSLVFAGVDVAPAAPEGKEKAMFDAFRDMAIDKTLAITSTLEETEEEKQPGEKLMPFILSRVHPHFLLSFTHDDNIYLVPEQTRDFITNFDMGFKFAMGLAKSVQDPDRNKLELDMGINTYTYADNSKLDRQKPYANINFKLGKGKRNLRLSHSFRQTSELLSGITPGATGLIDSTVANTELSYDYNLKHFAFALGLQKNAFDYEGQYNPTSTYHENVVTLTGFLKPRSLPKTRFLLESSFAKGEYIKSPTTDNNYTDLIVWLGAEGKLASKTTGIVKAGWEKRDYRNATDLTNLSVKVKVDYLFSPLTNFHLEVSRQGQQAANTGEGADDNSTINFDIKHNLALNKRFSIDLKLGYIKDKYALGRRDTTYSIFPTLGYAFRNWLAFELAYGYTDVSSTREEVSYKRNTYSLIARGAF